MRGHVSMGSTFLMMLVHTSLCEFLLSGRAFFQHHSLNPGESNTLVPRASARQPDLRSHQPGWQGKLQVWDCNSFGCRCLFLLYLHSLSVKVGFLSLRQRGDSVFLFAAKTRCIIYNGVHFNLWIIAAYVFPLNQVQECPRNTGLVAYPFWGPIWVIS